MEPRESVGGMTSIRLASVGKTLSRTTRPTPEPRATKKTRAPTPMATPKAEKAAPRRSRRLLREALPLAEPEDPGCGAAHPVLVGDHQHRQPILIERLEELDDLP